MSQGTLFGSPASECPAPVERIGGDRSRRRVAVNWRPVAVPHGKKDRQGRYWYERFRSDLEALPAGDRELLLEMILDWPVNRHDAFRLLVERWIRAEPLERDNFTEASGR